MRTLLILLTVTLAAIGGYAFKEFAVARDAQPALTQDQVDAAISQYLKQHPAEVMEALKTAQAQAEQQQQAEATQALEDRKAEIYNNKLKELREKYKVAVKEDEKKENEKKEEKTEEEK